MIAPVKIFDISQIKNWLQILWPLRTYTIKVNIFSISSRQQIKYLSLKAELSDI